MINSVKLQAIREKMVSENIDAYIIPSSDPHISEYVPDHFKCLYFISGFSGSAGTLIITANFAGLWTDFRYFEQAVREIENSGFELVKLKVQHTPEYIEWLYEHLPSGATVAFDFKLMSIVLAEDIKNSLFAKQIAISNLNLLNEIWEHRPKLPSCKAFLLADIDSGLTFHDKLSSLRLAMIKNHADLHVISSLDDIGWLFNIRGNDVSYNPVTLCYAIISLNSATLYINKDKLSEPDLKKILYEGVTIKGYDDIGDDLASLNNYSLLLDDKRTCYQFFTLLGSSVKIIKSPSPLAYLKAVKNQVEIANINNAMIQDGVALTRFFKWLEENIGKTLITETSAAEKIEHFRKRSESFVGSSFAAISAYGPHAALPHYAPTKDTDLELLPKGLFLLDSGGQYFYGTTDVTRTVPLGETTEEESRDYTLVLSAMIFGSAAKFPKGTRGYQIDGIVRQQLWQNGINYGHGTGHGVGYYLNVHEGPQNIGPSNAAVSVDLGMLTSIEPGIYRPGKHGVRTENLVLTVEAENTDFGEFLQFETLTLAYIDTSILMLELLLPEQISWLNKYNQMVYNKLNPHLNESENLWLAKKCKPI